ncbi:DUF3667 domain-containing protein [Runella limosa]|uniref:DUF3667 domain-containing protein n=1 Tax=Runella limosa TaxID=370978 RepID=UPI00040C294B|nr:DUF3667 domain-containing protein [Runella limosa]
MSSHCLNCHQTLKSNFCPNCGQSTKTHRFSIEHFVLHDLVHGVLHLDKGFFYTIKELFLRPGHSIREYVQGKRVKHFNYFTFIILIITLGHFIGSISDVKLIDTTNYFSDDQQLLTRFEELMSANPKIVTMLRIPFLALFSLLFFRKSEQNYTEHLVLNIYKVSGELLIAIVFTLLAIVFKNVIPLNYFFVGTGSLILVFSIWFYYQYFSVFGYSKIGLFIRSLLISVIIFLAIASITAFMIGVQDGFNDAK